MKGGLLSGIKSNPEPVELSAPSMSKLSTADLLKMTGSRERQDRIIFELEKRWVMHFAPILFAEFDSLH